MKDLKYINLEIGTHRIAEIESRLIDLENEVRALREASDYSKDTLPLFDAWNELNSTVAVFIVGAANRQIEREEYV